TMAAVECPLCVFLPATGPAIRQMQDARGHLCVEEWLQQPRNFFGISWSGKLIRDGRNALLPPRFLQDSVDKARPIRTKNPGDPEHEGGRIDSQNLLLTFAFRFAVDADWIWSVLLLIGLPFLPVKNIVGTHVNEARPSFATDLGH